MLLQKCPPVDTGGSRLEGIAMSHPSVWVHRSAGVSWGRGIRRERLAVRVHGAGALRSPRGEFLERLPKDGEEARLSFYPVNPATHSQDR
jgi:hypothetical protein